ncbi:ANKK1, partial [Symbiodinium sp. KB8]
GTEDSAKAIEAIKALTAKDAAPGALAAALDMPDARGNTALMLAARWGNIRLVEELVALGANPNAAACYYEFGPSVDPSRAEADVGRGANGERGFQCLTADVLTAPDLRADDVLTAALKPPDGSAKSRRSHRNATGEATLTGEGKEAKKLLYPTWGQLIVETPLHNAAEQTRGALAAILAREGVCVNLAISPEGWTPLHVAANTVKLGQLSAVEMLLSKGACVNAKDSIGMTPLAWEVAMALIRNGAVVNGPVDHSGSTCLHGAAVLGYSAVAEELVKAGADMEVQGESGLTPLLVALSVSRSQAALTLIRLGADVNKRGNGNEAVVAALLKAGASVNALDHHCVSPLLAAAARGQLQACRILTRWGANDRLYNLDGHAPYSLARLKGYGATAQFLERYRRHIRPWRQDVMAFRAQVMEQQPALKEKIAREWRTSQETLRDRAGAGPSRYTGAGGASTFAGSVRGGAPSEVTSSSHRSPPGGSRGAGASVAATTAAVRP